MYCPNELYLIVQYSSDKARSECYKESFLTNNWDVITEKVFNYHNAAKYIVLNYDEENDVYTYQNHKRKINISVINKEYNVFTPIYEKYTDFEYLISRQEMIDALED